MAFTGWPTAALEFYEGLEADNSKAYWTSHKAVYQERVLRPMEELLEDLVPEFGPSKIFRPYRDIRFSNDKTPYKTHIGATVGGTGYVQFSADGLSAGTGMWHLEPDELVKYRAAVAGPTAPSSPRSWPASSGRASRSTGTARSSRRPVVTRPTTPGSSCCGTRA